MFSFLSIHKPTKKNLIVAICLLIIFVLGVNYMIPRVGRSRAKAKATTTIAKIHFQGQLIENRMFDLGCDSYYRESLSYQNPVTCSYVALKLYKASGDYASIMAAAEAQLNALGMERAVSGSGCDSLQQCLKGASGARQMLSQGYYDTKGNFFGLMAFDNKSALLTRNADQLQLNQLQHILHDGEFIYGVDTIYTYYPNLINYAIKD